MRLAYVTGRVTLHRAERNFEPGSLLICEALDAAALDKPDPAAFAPRSSPMPESLVVLDQLGAGPGDLIAFTEGPEAANPFRPRIIPIDALSTAILDRLTITHQS
jgi:microcompartment protein CcmK/EutM